jgi:hypothetical protein
VVAAVVLAAGAAIIELRNTTVTTEATGRGGGADASNGNARIPPLGPVDGSSVRAPSSGDLAVPFQIRPAAVIQDVHQGDRAGSATEQPESTQPTAGSPGPSSAPETASGSSPAETPPGEPTTQPGGAPVEQAAEAEAPAPTVPVPAMSTELPPATVVVPTPASPTPDPVTPSEPTAAPPATSAGAAPTRGQSAAHRPDHANGGVGHPEHPAPADPDAKPDK